MGEPARIALSGSVCTWGSSVFSGCLLSSASNSTTNLRDENSHHGAGRKVAELRPGSPIGTLESPTSLWLLSGHKISTRNLSALLKRPPHPTMRPEKHPPDKPKAACRRGVHSCFCLVHKHEACRWHAGGHAHGMHCCALAVPLSNCLMLFAGGIPRVVWVSERPEGSGPLARPQEGGQDRIVGRMSVRKTSSLSGS